MGKNDLKEPEWFYKEIGSVNEHTWFIPAPVLSSGWDESNEDVFPKYHPFCLVHEFSSTSVWKSYDLNTVEKIS